VWTTTLFGLFYVDAVKPTNSVRVLITGEEQVPRYEFRDYDRGRYGKISTFNGYTDIIFFFLIAKIYRTIAEWNDNVCTGADGVSEGPSG